MNQWIARVLKSVLNTANRIQPSLQACQVFNVLFKVKHISSSVIVYFLAHMKTLRLFVIHSPFGLISSSKSFSYFCEFWTILELLIYCWSFLSIAWRLHMRTLKWKSTLNSHFIYLSIAWIISEVFSTLIYMGSRWPLQGHCRLDI